MTQQFRIGWEKLANKKPNQHSAERSSGCLQFFFVSYFVLTY